MPRAAALSRQASHVSLTKGRAIPVQRTRWLQIAAPRKRVLPAKLIEPAERLLVLRNDEVCWLADATGRQGVFTWRFDGFHGRPSERTGLAARRDASNQNNPS